MIYSGRSNPLVPSCHVSPEDGDSMFIRNVYIDLRTDKAPKPKTTPATTQSHKVKYFLHRPIGLCSLYQLYWTSRVLCRFSFICKFKVSVYWVMFIAVMSRTVHASVQQVITPSLKDFRSSDFQACYITDFPSEYAGLATESILLALT